MLNLNYFLFCLLQFYNFAECWYEHFDHLHNQFYEKFHASLFINSIYKTTNPNQK